MANELPQEIFAVITTQKRLDGRVYNHMIFGLAEMPPGNRLQPLKKDGIYLWVGTTASGESFSGRPGPLGISEDGKTVGRQVYIDDPLANQWVNWQLFEMPAQP